MKTRARRRILAMVTAGGVLLLGVLVFNRGAILDHVEAWWFVRTRATVELSPRPAGDWSQLEGELLVLQHLAIRSGRPVIYEPGAGDADRVDWDRVRLDDEALAELRRLGYRILDRRFPRAAYVVLGFPGRPGQPPDGQARSRLAGKRRKRLPAVEAEAPVLDP